MSEIKIIIGGDIFPRYSFDLWEKLEMEKLYSRDILDIFRNADFSICNLEGAFTDFSQGIPKCGPSIKASPKTIAGIRALGIDCLALANNHVMDYGKQGYIDTCKTLEEAGIDYFGTGDNVNSINTYKKTQIKGKTIIFYAVGETVFNIPSEDMPGINLYDEYRVCNELKVLKEQCDFLIVLYHGGVEYFTFPTPWIRQRFHRMADCGADMVIAQHTHCIGAQERYNGSYLLYGQGNFHFIQYNEKEVTQSGLLLDVDAGGESLNVMPHLVYMDGDMCKYCPKQDLSDFYARSKRVEAGESFKKEFSAYCEKWFVRWLMEFRGNTVKDRIMRRLLSKEKFISYLRRQYNDTMVLRMLEHVRGEEDVEVMQQGLSDFFYMNK